MITAMDQSSLEADPNETVVTYTTDSAGSLDEPEKNLPPDGKKFRFSRKLKLVAVIIVGLIVIAVVIISLAGHHAKKKPATTVIINTQSLSAGTLNKIESQAGTNQIQEQLTISPNTLFEQNVTVQGTAHVLGAMSLGSNLAVAGQLSVAGSSNVGGDLSVSGLLTATSLSVGSLTISTLHLTSDLNFGGHIISTGTAPKEQLAGAAGNAAIAYVSGSDTSGTVSITTGPNPSAGQLMIVTFHTPFNLAPQIQLTPKNADSAAVEYYATTSATYFTINTADAPAAGTDYVFDYFVSQ